MSWRSGRVVDLLSVPLARFKDGQVERVPAGEVAIEEMAADGAGRLAFITATTSLRILPDNNNHPIKWYHENKCADGAILLERDGHVELHVVELKSKLDTNQWKSARRQLEGMVVNALALAGALALPAPAVVICYLPYNTETISAFLASSTVAQKLPVGTPAVPPSTAAVALHDFSHSTLTLGDGQIVSVRRLVRDTEGNASVDLR